MPNPRWIASLLLPWILLSSQLQAADRPNIVFFFADDQTTSTLGCYGNSLIQTPQIDRLAREGVRFRNAFVSHSICWVSRTTILTGLLGRTYGTPGNRELARPEAVASLYTDHLKEAGYRTGFYGKWHAKMPPEFRREDHFDEFQAISRNPFYKPQPDGSVRHETELIVDRGIQFLENQSQDRPFALNLWFNACHAEDSDRRPGIGHFPWPRAVDGMYDDLEIPPPRLNDPAVFEALPDFLKTTINRERFFWRWNTPEKYQLNIRAYYRMTSGIDQAIGRFLDALEEHGFADNTIVVYSADNGYYLGNRGLAGKWSHYEESLRVPMIVYDPRLPPEQRGRTSDDIALNVDLPATFLDWAGVDVPAAYQGRSLSPLVSGETVADWRNDSFHEHFAVRHRIPAFEGIRNQQYKYVRYVDHDGKEFLHDLQQDPDELINFVADPRYADVLADMRRRTDQRVQEVAGPLEPLSTDFSASTTEYPTSSALVGASVGADGFVDLLAGNNLRQWAGDRRLWTLKDGVLTGQTDGSLAGNRFLTWKFSTVKNFDLRVQVKINEGGNSGIQYRSQSRPDLGLEVVSGYQCDVVPNNSDYDGMLYEERGRRILAHAGEKVAVDTDGSAWIVDRLQPRQAKAEQWQEYRILVQGNHYQHWIDGVQTVDVVDLDANLRALEGVLALQVHAGPPMTVQFKNMRIKHLSDDLPLVTDADYSIPNDAVGVRPQGRLPAGWKAPLYGDARD